jgi:hypothetical protein
MKKTLYYAVILLFCSAFPAQAANVYTDCAVPPSTFRHVWYIDPVHGTTPAAGGNGSQARPWNSLSAVARPVAGYQVDGVNAPLLSTAPYYHFNPANKTNQTWTNGTGQPIKPGDEILLMSGNYGDVFIGGLSSAISNSNFVTVAAAPGQTPVLTSLFVGVTNKWVFNGLKVQSLQSANRTGNALVQIKDGGATLPTSDIVLENLTISSTNNAGAWSQAQWRTDARNGFSAQSTAPGTNTKCVSLTGSHISNVRFGASLVASQLLFSNNQIDHFGDDGIDYAASNLAITKNDIHDNLDIGDGIHSDAMQGQIGILAPGATVNHFQNVLIDSNLIIRQSDPELSFPTYLQGIDAFDSDWTNVTVTNNVVITGGTCWGIGFGSLHNGRIVNNTVVNDGRISAPGCAASVWIVDKTHEGASTSNTVVRNNLASRVWVYNLDSGGIEADHNVAMLGSGPELVWDVNGVTQDIGKQGTYANGNIIDSGGPTSEFVDFDPSRLTYNVMLKYGAPAIAAGTATGAPAVDILGVARAPQHTAGAYSYPK